MILELAARRDLSSAFGMGQSFAGVEHRGQRGQRRQRDLRIG
jgi:hypothetical protein